MANVGEVMTAKAAGFAMPAEWEPHARCWMQWPYRQDFVWPDVGETQAAYARVARAVRRFEPVTMVVSESELANARERCGDDVDYLVMDLDDSWARDAGPNFVRKGSEVAASIFHFNAWGRKYEQTRHDAAVGHRIAEHLGVRTFTSNVFMEGGGINVDGQGTILTSESCILNENRNPGLSKSEAEQILCDSLGGSKVIWVPGDPLDQETDGHIDGLACFIRPGAVLCEVGNPDDPDRQKDLAENWRALELATDAAGNSLEIFPIDEAFDAEPMGEKYCGSFINFYIANGGIVAPTYGTDTDTRAHNAIQDAFPEHELVTVNIDHIAVAGGGIHCITQQQPK
jgi:agmatine deiminase